MPAWKRSKQSRLARACNEQKDGRRSQLPKIAKVKRAQTENRIIRCSGIPDKTKAGRHFCGKAQKRRTEKN